jgi:AcrR family transcriptional regulator
VAAEAEVSAEFVYKNVGRKGALLAAVLDVAIGGDDERVAFGRTCRCRPVARAHVRREVLAGYVQLMVPVQERVAPLLVLATQSSDPTAAALLSKAGSQRLAGMAGLAQHLHRLGGMRPGLDAGRTRDVLWTCTVRSCTTSSSPTGGWAPADYGEHVSRCWSQRCCPG